MIAFRRQPWKLSRQRAGEFHRTRRTDARLRPMLTVRCFESAFWSDLGALWLSKPDPKPQRRSGKSYSARPGCRTRPWLDHGLIRCVKSDDWWDSVDVMSPPHRRHYRRYGMPPASMAPHALKRMGYVEFPF